MFLKDKKLEVLEYTPITGTSVKKVDKKIPVISSTFTINLFRLAVAIAKTTFTKTPDYKYKVAESLINILRVATLIYDTKDKRFLLNKDRLDLIRDFSKTTRIGELAQGICFLFVQDILKIPTPYDFVGYCESVHKTTPTGSTPDFIGCFKSGTYDLIESKGSFDNKNEIVNSRLNKALKQCEEGESFLKTIHLSSASRKFGVLTVFESQYSPTSNNSSIHFIDPSSEFQNPFNSWQLIVAYYRTIITGFTGFDLIKQSKDIEVDEVTIQQHSFKLFDLNLGDIEQIWPELSSYPRILRFGISTKILELLSRDKDSGEDYFKNIQQISENIKRLNENPRENLGYEIFADGTIFKLGY